MGSAGGQRRLDLVDPVDLDDDLGDAGGNRPAQTFQRRRHLIGAARFDALTRELQRTLGLTVFLITHDLDTLHEICDRVAVLADKKVLAIGTLPELLATDHPWIQEYFNGPRGRAAAVSHADEERKKTRHPASSKSRGFLR